MPGRQRRQSLCAGPFPVAQSRGAGIEAGSRIAEARRMKTSEMVTKDDLKTELDLVVKAMRHETGTLAARLDRVEARLATLPTKQHVDDAISKLATKQELKDAIAKLATKQELKDAIAKVATKQELRDAIANLATKQELQDSIANLATKDEMAGLEQRLGNSIAEVGKQIAALTPRRVRKH
jgi:hypothetical protein